MHRIDRWSVSALTRALALTVMTLAAGMAGTAGCGGGEGAAVTVEASDAAPDITTSIIVEAGTPPTDDAGQTIVDSGKVDAFVDTGVPDSTTGGDGGTDDAGDAAVDDASDAAPVLPTLSIDSVSVDESAGTATLTVTLSAISGSPVFFDYATADGTATSAGAGAGGTDYAASTKKVRFTPGELTKTITLSIAEDDVNEADETFTVVISNPIGATLGTDTGTVTIVNNDAAPTLSIADVFLSEGNSGTTTANFDVTLSAASGQTVTVHAATTDGTATTANNDYTALPDTTLTFAPGEVKKTVSITVAGDLTVESNETFTVDLTQPTNTTLAKASGVGTIQNDDGLVAPSISITDESLTEGDTGTSTLTFTVTLSAAQAATATVDYKTTNVTAAAGADYESTTGKLTFLTGETSKTITVNVAGDVLDEDNETFTIDLSNPVQATIAKAKGTGTINDNDATPTVSIAPVTAAEGSNLAFTATLSAPSGRTVTVGYATADGTAVSGGFASNGGLDYVAATGTLTFLPGVTTQPVVVTVNNDALDEPDETLSVTLTPATNVLAGTVTATGTITDNDAAPAIVINSVSQLEGNAGSSVMTFTVSLVDAANQPVTSARNITVSYATANGTATGGAAAGAGIDYQTKSGTLSFPAGTYQQTVDVTIFGDVVVEPSETFTVNLTTPVNATIQTAAGTGTIQADDSALPFVNIGSPTAIAEGTGGTKVLSFPVTLTSVPAAPVTVSYATANGTATAGGSLAAGTADYVAATGTVTFNTGITSQTIDITINGDTIDENNEAFTVTLSNPTGATIQSGTGTGTINDDDAPPTITINDQTTAEGNAGTKTVTFTVSLSAASTLPITVDYATANDSATTGDGDYVNTSGTLTFTAGQTSRTFTVTINGDTKFETDEQFRVNLLNPSNATIADAQGVGTITNDDSIPTVTIGDRIRDPEGTGNSTRNMTFTVTLSNARYDTVRIVYATSDGTAVAGSDYVATSGTVDIAAGATTATFTVAIYRDNVKESTESFNVTISISTNPDHTGRATIADGAATGTIVDDD